MSCADQPALVWEQQDPSSNLDHAVSFEFECAKQWRPWIDFTSSERIRVYAQGNAGGYEFEAEVGGRTAGKVPKWVTTADPITDGSVQWAHRALSNFSLRKTLVSVMWTADAAITVSNQTIEGLTAVANLAGGVDGEDYSVIVTATFSDGTSLAQVCVLPVRRAVFVCPG